MFSISVLVSGGGSNLQSLIDACETGRLKARINKVIADREAYGLKRAEKAGIPAELLDRRSLKAGLSDEISRRIPGETDLVVLAGYLSILDRSFTKKWAGKIINIHPALLPDFGGKGMYGMHVHRAVLEAGREKSGCSVHYVDAGVDTGEVILRREVPVLPGDSPEDLQQRIIAIEHQALVEAVAVIIEKNH
jgi:phosphoribosylglycinamide formyltransferase-1